MHNGLLQVKVTDSGLVEDRIYGVAELGNFKWFSDNCIKVWGGWVFR